MEPRNNGSQGTSNFFPVVPNSGVANLNIFDNYKAKKNKGMNSGTETTYDNEKMFQEKSSEVIDHCSKKLHPD